MNLEKAAEFKTIEIALGVRLAAPLPATDLVNYYALVRARVDDEARNGWQPAERVDFNEALRSGRIRTSKSRTWLGLRSVSVYDSVTLAMRRSTEALHDRTWSASVPWFDVLRELNAHAGRLLALAGITFALLTFSVTTAPIQDRVGTVVSKGWAADEGASAVVVFLALAAVSLFFSFFENSVVILFPLPDRRADQKQADAHVQSTRDSVQRAARYLDSAFLSYVLAWYAVYETQFNSTWNLFGIPVHWIMATIVLLALTRSAMAPTVRHAVVGLSKVVKRISRELRRDAGG